ncbi:MAG: exodeoxyribonuclease VII small subunit [Clostridia bacterium]|nr:exodeoxyribonuclease VII small subunit [Clostridia bacterium]
MENTPSTPSVGQNPDLSYEQAFSKLELIVSRLESGDATLDESVSLFQEGMGLAKVCAGKLAAIEHQISQLLINEDQTVIEKPFGEQDV